jgi:copper chaperone NosL
MMRKGAFALLIALAACKQDAATVPQATVMTDLALGHYCQMYLADHAGPKAQIHLDGYDQPLWFSQVSDAVAYVHDPEQIAPIAAIYVSDMGKAASWAEPGNANWIAATDASFVIESAQLGGMGIPEAIPFGTKADADAFVAAHGGKVVSFDSVPEDYVRAPMTDTDATGESQ